MQSVNYPFGVAIAVFGILLAAPPAHAYRPFNTEDAGVAGKGVFQAELSWDSYKWKNGDRDKVSLLVAPIYGPTEDIELSTEIPFIVHSGAGRTNEGLGDINLVAKYVLAWENYQTKDALFTMKGIVKLKTGDYDKGLGRGDVEYSLVPVFTKIITRSLTVHGQAGYSFVADKTDPNLRNFASYGAAADYALAEPLHIVLEMTGGQNPDRTKTDQKLGLVGFTYTINPNFILDASYKKGFTNASPDRGYGIGVAIQF